MAFGYASCQNSTIENQSDSTMESIPTEILESFETVELFKIAVKKTPAQYNGKRVAIKGYANPLFSRVVYLFDNLPADDELWDDRVRIRVSITDSVQLSVLEKGDYIEINGIVSINIEEIVLDYCTYTMLKTKEEN